MNNELQNKLTDQDYTIIQNVTEKSGENKFERKKEIIREIYKTRLTYRTQRKEQI